MTSDVTEACNKCKSMDCDEDGPADDPSRRYPTQVLILLEAEWSWDSLPQVALVTRVHHRSGAYGTIAPSGVGSNFVAAGLRYHF